MKQKIISIVKHPLISNSIIVTFGGLAAALFNFLFNVFMGNYLKPADFGILASLVSVLSLALVVANAAIPVVINFAGNYFAKNDLTHVRGLFRKITLYYFILGCVVFLIFLIFPVQIGSFFNIHQPQLLILSGFTILFIFIGIVNMALLQAKLLFGYSSFTLFVGATIKFLGGVLLYWMGWGLMGAIWAVFLSFFIPYILNFYPLRFLFSKDLDVSKLNGKELFVYGAPAAIALFCVTSFVSTDILLVKHFFSPESAGIYAGLSLVGRVIFFLTAPISTVMFPLITQKYAKNEDYDNTFILSMLMILIPSVVITLFYFLFPTFSIHFFFKKQEYLQTANLLGIFGIFITVYALLNIFTNFYLSIKRTNIFIPILIAALAQVIFLWFFHQTFFQVISISLTVTTILLLFFIGYYFTLRKPSTK